MTTKRSGVWRGEFDDIKGRLPNGQLSSSFDISYTVQGNAGPVVLMVHGFLTNRNQFFALQALMSPFCRTIAIDLLGMGDSTKFVTGGTDLYLWGNDVQYIKVMMSELYPGERFLFVGDHWGSDVAFTYATKYSDDLFGVININSTLMSDSRSMAEMMLGRWSNVSDAELKTVSLTFESTITSILKSMSKMRCMWPDRCIQLFVSPYYNWRQVGGDNLIVSSSSTVPVSITKTIDSSEVGNGGVANAVVDMSRDATTDIANDLLDDGRLNESNTLSDTALVAPSVRQSLTPGVGEGSLGLSRNNGSLSSLQRSVNLDPNSRVTDFDNLMNGSIREADSLNIIGTPVGAGTIQGSRTATTTTISSAADASVRMNGRTTDVTVPATINVLKEVQVSTGGKRMVSMIDEHSVRALCERCASAYMERTSLVGGDDSLDYFAINVPMMFINGCDGSLATPRLGWKMLNLLNVPVRVVELEGAGHLVVVEKPKRLANISMEYIINLVGKRVLAREFDGYDYKPATAMCSWVKDDLLSFTVVNTRGDGV